MLQFEELTQHPYQCERVDCQSTDVTVHRITNPQTGECWDRLVCHACGDSEDYIIDEEEEEAPC